MSRTERFDRMIQKADTDQQKESMRAADAMKRALTVWLWLRFPCGPPDWSSAALQAGEVENSLPLTHE